MTVRRAHLALTAVLAGTALLLTGCSDDSAAGAASGKQTTPAGQQTTPGEKTTPAGEETTPADSGDGGNESGFCGDLEDSGDALSKWNQESAAGQQAALKKTFADLAAKAPADIKPSMQAISEGYVLISEQKVTEEDGEKIAKFATAIEAFNKWLPAHCPGLDIPVAAPTS